MSSVVTVEIGGQRYPIRSVLDERYVTELAAYVDQKMRAASDSAPANSAIKRCSLAWSVSPAARRSSRETTAAQLESQ